jgi:predicted nucleic acid-binding protein
VILYCDTSTLLKLYINEDQTDQVIQSVNEASAVLTHLIAYAELRASLAKAQRMGRITKNELQDLTRDVDEDWRTFHILTVGQGLVSSAGAMAEHHGLRGYDSVHLAAAEFAFRSMGEPEYFRFAVFDKQLGKAANRIGIKLL